MDAALPHRACLHQLAPWSLALRVTAHATPAAARDFPRFRGGLLAEIGRAVAAEGAWLAEGKD